MHLTLGFIFVFLLFNGCTTKQLEEVAPPVRPPHAGIIHQVNRAEHYLVFEGGQPIPPGTGMTILRNGRKIGTARVVPIREKKFQVADILSGAPLPGDLCEPVVLQPEPGQQSERRRLSP